MILEICLPCITRLCKPYALPFSSSLFSQKFKFVEDVLFVVTKRQNIEIFLSFVDLDFFYSSHLVCVNIDVHYWALFVSMTEFFFKTVHYITIGAMIDA